MYKMTISAGDCCIDIKRSLGDVFPAHYTLEIDSFSDLQKMVKHTNATRFESQTFKVGENKWKLCLYPNGDEERNGKGYISMSLVIVETDTLPFGWKVEVKFKFFVYNYIQDKFLKLQDIQKRVWRFDRNNKECEFPRLMLQTDFHNPNSGYLKDDRCKFGAQIGMCNFGKREVISPIKNVTSSYAWKLNNFSTSYAGDCYYSEVFTMAAYKWKFQLYPKGEEDVNGIYLSLFLCFDKSQAEESVYADFKLSILNQKKKKDHSHEAQNLFHGASGNWGWVKFMSLKMLEDESNGFLVADSLVIEAQITGISALKIFS